MRSTLKDQNACRVRHSRPRACHLTLEESDILDRPVETIRCSVQADSRGIIFDYSRRAPLDANNVAAKAVCGASIA